MKQTYSLTEKGIFDPYNIIMVAVKGFSWLSYWLDRGLNWVYDGMIVSFLRGVSLLTRGTNTGLYTSHIAWSLAGLAIIAVILVFYI